MQLSVIQIGNSKGIRLSKTLLEQYNITEKVELVLKEGFLVLKPVSHVRKGWSDSFEQMAAEQDDHLLIDDIFEDEFVDGDEDELLKAWS